MIERTGAIRVVHKHLPLSHPVVEQRLQALLAPEPEPEFTAHDAWVVELDEAIDRIAREIRRMAEGPLTVAQRRLLKVIVAELSRRIEF